MENRPKEDMPPGLTVEQLRTLNAHWREEAQHLMQQNQDLMRQISEERSNSEQRCAARLAALNLMEDAVAARHSEQRESLQRLHAESELRRSVEKYRTLFESIDEGFFILQKVESSSEGLPDFLIAEANPAFAAHIGIKHVAGMTMRQAFAGEPEDWYLTFGTILDSGRAVRFERELVSRSRIVELYAFRLEHENQQQVAVLCRDVSERKAAEQELRDADRRKDEFLATLAHELRNPLAPISNCLQLLRTMAGFDADALEFCEMMQRQVDHMVRLVDDLMEVSRITRGMIELRPDQTDLGTILRGAVEQSGPVIESFGHELIISLPEDPLPIFGDVIRLGQVFANLLNNAARYTDQSGRIWLSAGQEGNEAVVTVRDTGIGIEPAMLPAIFGLFAQADTSRTRSQSGLGIGLTLAKRLVEMHAGTISARSEGLGQGSEFIVRLPLAEVPAPVPGESGNGEPGSDLVLRRVLVVDDNADSADSLGMLLRSLGTEVRTVYDGPLARRGRPGLPPGRGLPRYRHAGYGRPGSGPPDSPVPGAGRRTARGFDRLGTAHRSRTHPRRGVRPSPGETGAAAHLTKTARGDAGRQDGGCRFPPPVPDASSRALAFELEKSAGRQ